MNILRRKVKDSLMITNGYIQWRWQPAVVNASATAQTIDSQGLADRFARWQSPQASARSNLPGGNQ
jgi:hypothetical protein